MRVALFLGSIFLLAGCGPEVPRVGGTAAPVASAPSPAATPATARTSTSTPTTTRSSTSASPEPTATRRPSTLSLLGPYGFGALKLGMSEKQATATGLIDGWSSPGPGCGYSRLRPASAEQGSVLSAASGFGVVVIDAYGDVRTPEGIHIGSTVAAARKAYPELAAAQGGSLEASAGIAFAGVPRNGDASYRVAWSNWVITQLTLQHHKADCYE